MLLFWAIGAALVVGYVLLFLLARRPVTLRLHRLGWLLLGVAGLRLVLAVAGAPFGRPLEDFATLALLAAALVLVLTARRVWLVRATPEGLREQIQAACRGLFLGVTEEPPGRLKLTAPGEPLLRLWKVSP